MAPAGFWVGISDQELPFQLSASVTLSEYPTAVQADGLVHETPVSVSK
jgi:hypothetical protein